MQVREIGNDDFDEHVMRADAPFVMRNVALCNIEELRQGFHASKRVKLAINDSFRTDTFDICLGLRNRLGAIGCQFVNNRFWDHNRGHVTRWHFDGDGVQVLNICLTGSKLFEFASPGTVPFIPFTNLPLASPKTEQRTIIHPGDVLFFPSFWFHKVTCLEDSTITYNICTTRDMNPCPRNAANICYHRMLSTKMGMYSHFNDIKCNNFIYLLPEFAFTFGAGAIMSFLISEPLRRRVPNVILGILVYCVMFERTNDNTHGTITANMIPFTIGFNTITTFVS